MRYKFLRYPEGKAKAVTFSYDDGCLHDEKLSDILTKYGLKCTFNINNGFLSEGGDEFHLSIEKVKKHIIDAGHEVAVHGELHCANGYISPLNGIQEVLNCRLGLEQKFGMLIRGMAYPDSGVSRFENETTYEQVKNYLTYLGIVYARALCGTVNDFTLPNDWHKWLPTAHHNDPQIFEKIENFLNISYENRYISSCHPILLYIWGHSYEFANNNNWDRLEKISETLSGRDDIWYATNMEIYEYVTAYNSLIFSADDSFVYNPSLKTVWFFGDDKIYKVNSGETIKLS